MQEHTETTASVVLVSDCRGTITMPLKNYEHHRKEVDAWMEGEAVERVSGAKSMEFLWETYEVYRVVKSKPGEVWLVNGEPCIASYNNRFIRISDGQHVDISSDEDWEGITYEEKSVEIYFKEEVLQELLEYSEVFHWMDYTSASKSTDAVRTYHIEDELSRLKEE